MLHPYKNLLATYYNNQISEQNGKNQHFILFSIQKKMSLVKWHTFGTMFFEFSNPKLVQKVQQLVKKTWHHMLRYAHGHMSIPQNNLYLAVPIEKIKIFRHIFFCTLQNFLIYFWVAESKKNCPERMLLEQTKIYVKLKNC